MSRTMSGEQFAKWQAEVFRLERELNEAENALELERDRFTAAHSFESADAVMVARRPYGDAIDRVHELSVRLVGARNHLDMWRLNSDVEAAFGRVAK